MSDPNLEGQFDSDQLRAINRAIEARLDSPNNPSQVNGIAVVASGEELGSLIESATSPMRYQITTDITISPGDVDWTQVRGGSVIESANGLRTMTFDGTTDNYAGGGIITIGENPETNTTQRNILFRDLDFIVEPDVNSNPLFYFSDTPVGNPWRFGFKRCDFKHQGGGPTHLGEGQSFYHYFDNCVWDGMTQASNPPEAYVRLGGTHVQHYGSRFFNISNGSWGCKQPDGVGGTARFYLACKFGSIGSPFSTGNGLKLFNADGAQNSKNQSAVIGCSFETLADKANGGIGIESRGGVFLCQNFVNGVGDFLVTDFSGDADPIWMLSTHIGGKSVDSSNGGYVIDAASNNTGGEYVITDAYGDSDVGDSLINDPDNVVVGPVGTQGFATVSPDGSTKQVIGIDNTGSVVADDLSNRSA